MICSKHGVEMFLVPERVTTIVTAPLHRCAVCTEEFRERYERATRVRSKRIRNLIQRSLPPVIMSERWP